MEENDNDYLLFTGVENSLAFKRAYEGHSDIAGFLSTHEYIPLRSTIVGIEESEYDLKMDSDIDGVTIEWKNIAGTTHAFHHLFLIPRGLSSLRNVYQWLKKHENLRHYTNSSRQMLKECVATTILADGGWEYVLCLLPTLDNNIQSDKYVISRLTLTWITEVKLQLRGRLMEAIPGGRIRQTIDKNNIHDVSQIFILPGDCASVLEMFQESVDSVVTPQAFRKVLFSFRFGEKNQKRVYLPIRDSDAVSKVCVHVGVSIQPCDDSESLFWSRTGLETVTGKRGTLTPACALYECANYQSNLDGRALDVSGELRGVSVFPEKVQFIQLYADVPHCYPKTRHHPVSATIIIPQGLRSASEKLLREALEYISVIKSNFVKLTKSVCRLEFVTSLPVIADSVHGAELTNLDRVIQLLNKHALCVPFGTRHFIESLRIIGLNLCETLERLFHRFKGTSCSESVWQTYQCELAVEKLLWGHPLTYLSRQHAINLGPGIEVPSRCASDQFGFLRLENKFACCSDEHCTPPLNIYSESPCVQRLLQKTFGFWDRIDGNELVLGRRLVEVLLHDLYDVGSVYAQLGTFVSSLKQGGHSMRAIGVISISQLANRLSSVKKCKFPMVYLHLLKMLRHRGKDLEQTIKKGLEELQLTHFPAFRDTDQHRHSCMYWHFSYGDWAIRNLNQEDSTEMWENLLCALVLSELEKRKLCFTRSLNGTNQSFPWVRACHRKLDELKLGEHELVLVMTFVTCVAFMESGRFVEYNKMRVLRDQLPVPQYQLCDLEIQGKFLVNNMNLFKVWRLHPSIPRQPPKMATETIAPSTNPRQVPDDSEARSAELDRASRIDENEYGNNILKTDKVASAQVRNLPANQRGRWNTQELAILHVLHEAVSKIPRS